MASYGPTWPQISALQGLLQQNYGLIRLATVYGLWFTRERSKVRSLVRPPFKAPQVGAFCFFGTRVVARLSAEQATTLSDTNKKTARRAVSFAVVGEIRLREVLKPGCAGDTP
jgi:hypothetical protein